MGEIVKATLQTKITNIWEQKMGTLVREFRDLLGLEEDHQETSLEREWLGKGIQRKVEKLMWKDTQ